MKNKYLFILIVLLHVFYAQETYATNDSICFDTSLHDNTSDATKFSWSANATFTSNYLWRGLYCGGPSVQVDATVDYAGFFANMWWNVGTTDWTFSTFNPELDIMLGFSRWGLNINYLYCFYFDTYPDGTPSRFFDFGNHPRGGGGTTGEWRVSYRVSDKIPLSLLVAFRTFGRDGYYEAIGREGDKAEMELKRAYSTYIQLAYDFDLTQDWLLAARVGITPAKSLYTRFEGNFAVTMVNLELTKTWQLKYGSVAAFAEVMLQPWQLTKDNLIKPIEEAGDQKLNLAVGCSVAFGN